MSARVALVAAGPEILGGHSVQADALARGLRDTGLEVDFVPINPRWRVTLGPLRRLPYLRTLVNQAHYLPELARLRSADVAHVFSASYWSFLLAPAPALAAARWLGTPVILHYHSGEADDHLSRWSFLVHPWLHLADAIVVPSRYLREVFGKHGYEARVIPNVVDLARFRYRERDELRPRFLSTRNLEPHYGVDVVLRAFARVQRATPEATLDIAGYGSEGSRLRRLASELGLSGVRFLGRVEPRAMPAVYDGADLFVNASVVDNQPVSVLEAFASGTPVISTPTGDLRFMVRHQDTGLSVAPEDPRAMAEAMLELLRRPEEARRLARRARVEAALHDWARVRDAWLELYAETLGAGGSRLKGVELEAGEIGK